MSKIVSMPKPRAQSKSKYLTITSLGDLLDMQLAERVPLLGTWLTERHLNMTYAPAGVGKSMFAMSCALAVAGGGSYLGWKASKPRRVLIVDGEMDVEDLQERSRALLSALPDCDPLAVRENVQLLARQDQPLNVNFPDLATAEGRNRVVGIATKQKAALVILDNFSTLATIEDENKASSFNPIIDLMQALKHRGMACILVHHSKKGSGNGSKQVSGGYRGTSKMAVIFNSIIALNHPDGIPSVEGTAFALQWEKYRRVRDEQVVDLKASLTKGAKEWKCDSTMDANLAKLVSLVKQRDYSTQEELAVAMKASTGAVSGWKKKIIVGGLMSSSEWSRCLSEARALKAEEAPNGSQDDF